MELDYQDMNASKTNVRFSFPISPRLGVYSIWLYAYSSNRDDGLKIWWLHS